MIVVGPRAVVLEQAAALAKLQGLPLRGVAYSGAHRLPDSEQDRLVPRTYSPGAPGWTDQAVHVDADDGVDACFELPRDLEKHLGRSTTVDGKSVALPTADKLAASESALPAGLKTIREAKRSGAADKKVARK